MPFEAQRQVLHVGLRARALGPATRIEVPSTRMPSDPGSSSKAERRAASAAVASYHQTELARLIDRVRDGIARFDSGDIDAFELDELIHHYHRATQKLWSFCSGSGGDVQRAARTLEWLREENDLPDWWEQATPRRFRDGEE